MIPFVWKKPSSVTDGMILAGTLVRVDEEVLEVDIRATVRNRIQEQVVESLEANGKLRWPDRGGSVIVFRREMAYFAPYTPLQASRAP